MTTQTEAQQIADELENTPFESTRYEASKELRRLAAVERELTMIKASLGDPVAWRYKAFAVIDCDRVPVREVDAARNEYTITQQPPHDWSHLHHPLDYPTYEDYEPLYALTKETK